jgi:REP element-mobilizing transposase RayT
MKYIGTSLGRCLRSILKGEVSEDQVFLIVTGTMSHTIDDFLLIIKQYHYERYGEYDISQWTYEEATEKYTSLETLKLIRFSVAVINFGLKYFLLTCCKNLRQKICGIS